MHDFVIIVAFFVMVLSPCIVAILSFRASESDDRNQQLSEPKPAPPSRPSRPAPVMR